jgi:hypothetical protein
MPDGETKSVCWQFCHRVETYRELCNMTVVNTAEAYVFMYPLSSSNQMHASSNLPSMRTKKVGTLVTTLYVSPLWFCFIRQLLMTSFICNTGHGSQVTGHGSRVTGHGSQVTGHRSRVTGHGSRVTGHGSQVAGHRSRVTGHGSQVTVHRSRITGLGLFTLYTRKCLLYIPLAK